MEKIDARKLSTEAQQQIRNQATRLKRPEGPTKKFLKSQGFMKLPPANGINLFLTAAKRLSRLKSEAGPKAVAAH